MGRRRPRQPIMTVRIGYETCAGSVDHGVRMRSAGPGNPGCVQDPPSSGPRRYGLFVGAGLVVAGGGAGFAGAVVAGGEGGEGAVFSAFFSSLQAASASMPTSGSR